MRHTPNFFIPQYQSALGTVLHATPVVEAIKSILPQARVIVASSGLAAQVWHGNPQLEALIQTPNPLNDLRGAVRSLRAARLFHGKPYITLLTTGNERSRITLTALLAGRSTRVGFAVHRALVQQHLRFDPARSQIANNLRLLDAIGLNVPAQEFTEPVLYPSGAPSALPPHASATRLRIALATQTSPTQRKSWPEERWIELCEALANGGPVELIFVGTAAERSAVDAIRSRIACPTISVAGQTTVPQLAATLADCDLGIMLDTGTLHVARGVGLPAVIIAPAWSPVHEWLPVDNPRYRILKNADLPPPAPDDYVITEVSVAEVLAAARDLLATAYPAAAGVGKTPES